ncbi:multidrug ABC transporter ATPase [Rothia kristinae]
MLCSTTRARRRACTATHPTPTLEASSAVLHAENITAKGRHAPLIQRTSLDVAPGELLLLQASGQLTRTALALVLTGRMKPESGSITWNEESSRKALRRHASIVDAPELNEMEKHMRVRDYVSEMLSYMPHPFLQRPHSGRWLEENGLADLNNLWDEQLTGEQRIRLMTALARHNSGADLLVFDTPSRHTHYSVTWIPRLLELAQDEEHPRAVIAVVPHISDKWYGPVAIEGDPHGGRHPAADEEGGRHRQPSEDPLPPTRMLSLEELFDLEAAAEEIEPEGDDADQTAENEN